MGDGDILVTIDGATYKIEKCPNDFIAIEEAIKLHKKNKDSEAKHYKDNDIRDKDNCPIYVDFSIDQIFVSKPMF